MSVQYYDFTLLMTVSFIMEIFRGAGQEVGRSCIMLEFKGKKIMVKHSVVCLYD